MAAQSSPSKIQILDYTFQLSSLMNFSQVVFHTYVIQILPWKIASFLMSVTDQKYITLERIKSQSKFLYL